MITGPSEPVGVGSSDQTAQTAMWKYHRFLTLLLYADIVVVSASVMAAPLLMSFKVGAAVVLLAGFVAFVLLAPIGAAYAFFLRRIRRRRRAGQCLRCGYPRAPEPEAVCTDCGELWWWHRYEAHKR